MAAIDDREFAKILNSTSAKNMLIGLCILLFGVGIVLVMVTGADPRGSTVTGYVILSILAALCLFFGLLIMYQQLKSALQFNKGRHPLLKAIFDNNSAYVVWFHEMEFKMPKGGTNYQVWIYGRDGSRFTVTSNAARITDVLYYLETRFPAAMRGYTKENENRHRLLLLQ